jgi:DNA polymerase III epsilon subunit-like protein
MKGSQMRIVFFDLETGGLDFRVHPIIQIAAIAVDERLQEIERFERKLKFDVNTADPEALRSNHYDADVWAKEAIDPALAATVFNGFLNRYADIRRCSKRTNNPYNVAQLAGHNASMFDLFFVQQWFKRYDRFLSASYRVLDTLQRAAWHFHERDNGPESLSLGSLAEYYGIKAEKAHDAMSDVETTIAVYAKLIGVAIGNS